MIIYHGSTETIKLPLAKVGRPDLDFGHGFYTTDMLLKNCQSIDLTTRFV